jgi:hypothetical protein
MRRVLIAVPLIALLVWSLWYASQAWFVDGPPMPAYGYLAMAGGVFFSLLIGGGLMALVFYSNRKGYDDAAGETPDQDH